MQFTPQQMAGAQRYGSQTRIGNWYEDERLAESRYASFTDKKERKLLASDNRHKKMDTCMQKVPLSFCEGQEVRYGSVIQLESAEVGGTLACDPFEEISPGSQTFLATVTPHPPQSPSPARMAFKVVAVTDPRLKDLSTRVLLRKEGKASLPDVEGEPVRYGDLFHLVGDPGLRVCDAVNMRRPPLYLASALKTQSLSSRVSNRQAVFLRSGASSGTVWQFQKTTHGKNGSVDRLSGVGQAIASDIEVVIQHRDTLMALSCERSNVEATDFGAEFEVCCESLTTNGRSLQLLAELEGRKTAGSAAKSELRANRWLVRQGQHETAKPVDGEHGDDQGGCARQLPPEMTPENLLEKAKCVVSGQVAGIQRLRNALRSIDPVGDGKLDREDFRWCLEDFGLTLDEEQSQILFDKYDKDASGLVEIEEFLSGLRQPLSERRKTAVGEAFRALAPDENGKVTLKQLQASFNAEAAGRALSGNATPTKETLDALRSGLGVGAVSRNGAITLADMERYHQDLCVDAAEDELFEGLVKLSWRGDGGTSP